MNDGIIWGSLYGEREVDFDGGKKKERKTAKLEKFQILKKQA